MTTADLTARLEAAALSLAGPGSIKERLTNAYSHLEDVEWCEVPELGADFQEMTRTLHRERPLPGDDVVRASVRKLSSEDVRHYAELLIRLYGIVVAIEHRRGASRNVVSVPGYLAAGT